MSFSSILQFIVLLVITFIFLYCLAIAILFLVKNKLKSMPFTTTQTTENFDPNPNPTKLDTNTIDPIFDGNFVNEQNMEDYVYETEKANAYNFDEYTITPQLYLAQQKNSPKKVYKVRKVLKPALNPYETQPLAQALTNSFIFPPDESRKHPDERRNEIAHTLMKPLNFSDEKKTLDESHEFFSPIVRDDHGQMTAEPTSCQTKHKHGNNCAYGPTNYPDPCDMTPVDREIFKASYPLNITLQDYVNWLWMYYDTPEDLGYEHLRNLKRLITGECLVYKAGVLPPLAKKSPPVNSQDYFQKLYNINNVRQLQTVLRDDLDGMMGYNYNDLGNFYQNIDQYGRSSDPSAAILHDNILEQKNPGLIDQLIRPLLTPKNPSLSQYNTQMDGRFTPKHPKLTISMT